MGRASKYKFDKGDEIGLYRVIKLLPSEPHVKNLTIYAECLLCGEKVKRFSNRLDSKHRGCTAVAKVDKTIEAVVIGLVPHTRANGMPADSDEPVAEVPDAVLSGMNDLPTELQLALDFDVDAYALELVKLGAKLDTAIKLVFMTSLKRYLALVKVARSLEKKLAETGDLTVIGSTGSNVSNPLITQYKSISNESNNTAKILTNILGKSKGSDEPDPLLLALAGGGDED